MIKIINNPADFVALQNDWDSLYDKNHLATPFQSYTFNYNNWNILAPRTTLHIICIYRQNGIKLIAIFPCILTRTGLLNFINGSHSDFCGPLIDEECSKNFYLYKELADYIKTNPAIKGFKFDNLKEDSCLLSTIGCFFKGTQTRITNKWSFFRIRNSKKEDKSFLDGIFHLSTKDKHRLKNVIKKSPESELKIYYVDANPYPNNIVQSIIDVMITSGQRSDTYFSIKFKEFLKKLYDDNLMFIACSMTNGKPIAANFYLLKDNEYIDWLAIYTDKKNNTSNLLQMMEYVYNNGGGTFNFARGLYGYKINNFRPEIHNLYRIEYSKTMYGQLKIFMSFCKYHLKELIRPLIKK